VLLQLLQRHHGRFACDVDRVAEHVTINHQIADDHNAALLKASDDLFERFQ
jgi:hypothetical protein